MQLHDWLVQIESFHSKEIDLGLDRCRKVYDNLKEAGHLEGKPLIVTIGGTNGKGTTLKTLENASKAAGLKVGSYTSPHVFVFNERVRVNGIDATDDELVAAFEKVEACRADVPLTYYEFTTLAAFIVFAAHRVDVLLLEVGLGGRLDTVNLLDADIAVLTSIALDHQAFLGNTRELIAAEKVEIARPDGLLFVGGQDLVSTIADYADRTNVEIYDYTSRQLKDQQEGWSLSFKGPQGKVALEGLPNPLIPQGNAALALQVWFYMANALQINPESIDLKKLIQETALFGRFSALPSDYDIRVDAAHNPAAAACLAEQLQKLPAKKTIAICGIMADKDVKGTFEPILSVFDQWVLWPLQGERALPQERLQQIFLDLGVADIAITQISKECSTRELKALLEEHLDARFIVFGSFFTIEAFMDDFKKL